MNHSLNKIPLAIKMDIFENQTLIKFVFDFYQLSDVPQQKKRVFCYTCIVHLYFRNGNGSGELYK